jgi:hypothetical protein
MGIAVLIAQILTAKLIQLIDNTSQQSHNPSQQSRNPPQQLCASLQFLAAFFIESSHFSDVLCSPKLATCGPAFDGENHTTDRRYTPGVSRSVTVATQFATATLRLTTIFSSFLRRIVTLQRCSLQPTTGYLWPEF